MQIIQAIPRSLKANINDFANKIVSLIILDHHLIKSQQTYCIDILSSKDVHDTFITGNAAIYSSQEFYNNFFR